MLKKVLITLVAIICLTSVIFPQNKIEYFLNDSDNYKKLPDDIANKVNQELVKIHAEWVNELNLQSLYLVNFTEKVITGQYFDESGYLTALLSMNNPSEYEAIYLKSLFTRTTFANIPGSKNRTISRDNKVFTLAPSWDDVMQHYGGYAEIAKKGVTKSKYNKGEYMVTGKLYEVEIADNDVCYARVKLAGNLGFNNINNDEVSYSGKYSLDNTDFTNIYKFKTNVPQIHFSFAGGKYMRKMNFDYPLTNIIGKEKYNEVSYKYAEALVLMIDAYVPESAFHSIDDIKEIRRLKKAEAERLAKLEADQERRKRAFDKIQFKNKDKLRKVAIAERIAEKPYNFGYWYLSKGTYMPVGEPTIGDVETEDASDDFAIGIGLVTNKFMFDTHLLYLSSGLGDTLVLSKGREGSSYFGYEELVVPSPQLRSIGINFELAYDFAKGSFPLRPFFGVGFGAYHSFLNHKDANEFIGNSDFLNTYKIYGFVEVMTKYFETPGFFVAVRAEANVFLGVGIAYSGLSLKFGR